MSMFYVPPECIRGDSALICGPEACHILNVMRLKKDEEITLFDGSGRFYQGKIIDTAKKQLKVRIRRTWKDAKGTGPQLTLVQAIPKKNKMDYIVEKCTELGVDRIFPCQTMRTIVQTGGDKKTLRRERWQRIAREAAKQSGRSTIPQVKDIISWPDVLIKLKEIELKLVFWLGENTEKIKKVLHSHNAIKEIVLCIGPEGDFTADEVKQAFDLGWRAVTLGRNVLKSDTAAVAALSMLNYELRL